MSYYNPFTLKGKEILITGASSGIGAACAVECSKMGAKLFITGRNINRLKKTFEQLEGEGHQLILADLTIEEEREKLLSQITTLDGIVLCSGVGGIIPIKFCSREKFNKIFEINFFATVEICRQLLRNKLIRKEGSIVTISSIGGNRVQSHGESIYGASKAALSAWMRYLALELANKSIRVNSILPGMTETPLITPQTLSAEQLENDKAQYPLKRYGKPQEIAWATIYLLSDASKWVTGSNLVIDGGISM